MRPTFGSPWTVVHTAARDVATHCTRPERTLAGLAVVLLAPLVAVGTLAAPEMVAAAVLSAGAALLASTARRARTATDSRRW